MRTSTSRRSAWIARLAGWALILAPAWGLAQIDTALRKQSVRVDAARSLAFTYQGGRLVHSGPVECPHLHRCGPRGLHYVYSRDGWLERLIEYDFSKDRFFEGVPERIWTARYFDRRGQLIKVVHGTRCTDCDATPVGVWVYYRQGRVLRRVDAVAQAGDLAQEVAESDYWEHREFPTVAGSR